MKQVLFAPEVEEDLYQLVRILVEKDITNNHINGQYFNV